METQALAHVFRFCPVCGGPLTLPSPGSLLCGACGYRHFLNPVVAVGAIVTDASGRVLLIRRSRDPGRGKLGVPGGFVDLGETAEEAVRRETREEVNLELTDLAYLTSYPNEYVFGNVSRPVLDLFYTARAPSFDALQALDGVSAVELVAPDEVNLDEIAFPSIRHALTVHFGAQRVTRDRERGWA